MQTWLGWRTADWVFGGLHVQPEMNLQREGDSGGHKLSGSRGNLLEIIWKSAWPKKTTPHISKKKPNQKQTKKPPHPTSCSNDYFSLQTPPLSSTVSHLCPSLCLVDFQKSSLEPFRVWFYARDTKWQYSRPSGGRNEARETKMERPVFPVSSAQPVI